MHRPLDAGLSSFWLAACSSWLTKFRPGNRSPPPAGRRPGAEPARPARPAAPIAHCSPSCGSWSHAHLVAAAPAACSSWPTRYRLGDRLPPQAGCRPGAALAWPACYPAAPIACCRSSYRSNCMRTWSPRRAGAGRVGDDDEARWLIDRQLASC